MVNYKGSLVKECSMDAVVVDRLLILVSYLQIFGTIMFRRVSNEVVVMRKKFLKPLSDLYSKFSKLTSSRTRPFIKSVVMYFFFARGLGQTQNRCSRNSQTFIILEIIVAVKQKVHHHDLAFSHTLILKIVQNWLSSPKFPNFQLT